MAIKLAVFDIDGTLVTHGTHILLDSTTQSIHKLQEKGIRVAIASGRALYSFDQQILDQVEFDYLISANGAYIYDQKNQKEIYRHRYDQNLVEVFTKRIEEENGSLMYQMRNNGYSYVDFNGLAQVMLEYLNMDESKIINQDFNQTRHLEEDPHHIIARIPDEAFATIVKEFPQLKFTKFLPEKYDVNDHSINKANGIKHIIKKLGIGLDEVIAFGDGLNDLEMLSEVKLSVAMGNAEPELKKVADYVTANSEDHGIKQGLVHFGIIEDF